MSTRRTWAVTLLALTCGLAAMLGHVAASAAAQSGAPAASLSATKGLSATPQPALVGPLAENVAGSPIIAGSLLPTEGLPVTLNKFSEAAAAVPPNMTETFEQPWPVAGSGWIAVDNSGNDGGFYTWGRRSCSPNYVGSYSAWAVGGGTSGSSLACGSAYPPDADTYAIYGPFSTVNAVAGNLSFVLLGTAENDNDCRYDYLELQYSTDGSTFYPASGRFCGTWQNNMQFNFGSSWFGQSQLWIAFRFVSDASNQYGGYFIDNVALNFQFPAPTNTPTPTPTTTSLPTVTPTRTATWTATARQRRRQRQH